VSGAWVAASAAARQAASSARSEQLLRAARDAEAERRVDALPRRVGLRPDLLGHERGDPLGRHAVVVEADADGAARVDGEQADRLDRQRGAFGGVDQRPDGVAVAVARGGGDHVDPRPAAQPRRDARPEPVLSGARLSRLEASRPGQRAGEDQPGPEPAAAQPRQPAPPQLVVGAAR
jgi:hypothetical protein